MGTELARHLVGEHSLKVWNRTKAKTEPLAKAGATVVDTPQEAVDGADVVLSCLFGPEDIRAVVLEPSLILEGVVWADATTVSPDDAASFAQACPTYVATSVLGTLGPAALVLNRCRAKIGMETPSRLRQMLDPLRTTSLGM